MSLRKVKFRRIAKLFAARIPSAYSIALRMRPGHHEEMRCYLRLVRKGMCVFDVGANDGHYTLLFSDLVGQHGRVHGFEPVPRSADQFRERMEDGAVYDNVELNNLAVTDMSGLELRIGIPNGDFGQASLASHSQGSWGKGNDIEYVECRTITLDDYAARRNIQRVDFIKIDVEGAELLVLKGAENLLRKYRPIIHLEYFVDWAIGFSYSLKDLVSFLESLGYDRFYADDLRQIQNFHTGFHDFNVSTNLTCSVGPLRPILG